MKKILSLITIAGLAVILSTGCESNLTKVENNINSNINSFKEDLSNCKIIETNATLLNKYNIQVESDFENDSVELDETINEIDETNNLIDLTEEDNEISDNKEIIPQADDLIPDETEKENITNEIENKEISTLYSLSCDINESCNEFCQLKNNISNAIIETQNLINKLQNKEISLTSEEKMAISDQTRQLKALGKQLSYITSELAVNLSDLSNLFEDENGNLDTLNMKYLIILDNLVNGNEMLYNSLYSLNMVNSLLGQNLNGNIMYGYKRNNEPPIFKNYSINNGEITENAVEVEQVENESENATIDSYADNKLKTNIDTYGNARSNIDSFFNTAWLDNDFMYGNSGGYGMPYGGAGMGMRNGYYPYVENNKVENDNLNTSNGVDNTSNTQQNENIENKKPKKKFKLEKNIDTYRDENTPTVSAKLTIIKDSISNFFDKFKNNEEAEIVREKIKSNIKD